MKVYDSFRACCTASVKCGNSNLTYGITLPMHCMMFKTKLLFWMAFKPWVHFANHHFIMWPYPECFCVGLVKGFEFRILHLSLREWLPVCWDLTWSLIFVTSGCGLQFWGIQPGVLYMLHPFFTSNYISTLWKHFRIQIIQFHSIYNESKFGKWSSANSFHMPT